MSELVPTEYYLRYTYGGIIGIDEIDAANPSVLVWLNGSIQNKLASFPRGYMGRLEYRDFHAPAHGLDPEDFVPHEIEAGGMVEMHPDCIVIASANTYGKGADMRYQGRNALDAATMKRFKVITWDYDEGLEMKLASNSSWTRYVRAVRKIVDDMELPHVVSPVDSIDGGIMLAAGIPFHSVVEQTVRAGLDEDSWSEINKLTSKEAAEVRRDMKREDRKQEVEAEAAAEPEEGTASPGLDSREQTQEAVA